MRVIVLLLAMLLAASPALAQTEAQPDPQKAQEAFMVAKEAYEKGDFRLSVAKLREAFRYYPDPAIRVSIARRLIDLDEPSEGLKELQQVVTRDRKLKRVVKSEIARVQQLLASPVDVTIDTVPPGGQIKIGDEKGEKGPLSRRLFRGKLRLSAILPGYKPRSQEVVIKGTKPMRIALKLDKTHSFLRIELSGLDPERAEEEGPPLVKLDDAPVGTGERFEVEPGKHVISCGYEKSIDPPTVMRVAVPSGKNALVRCALPAPLVEPTTWKTPAGWGSVGSGAAAIAASIGIFVSYAVDTGQYSDSRFVVESSKPLAGGITAGVGAALVGVGTWFLLSD